MAIMFPKDLNEYTPTDSERVVYQALKEQLPDTFMVFYSVSWTTIKNGKAEKSEADFIVLNPSYGFLCLEVKGGAKIRIDDGEWFIEDSFYGVRKLSKSPYDQAEKSMYYFVTAFRNRYNSEYHGIYAAGVVLPFFRINDDVIIDNRSRQMTIDMIDMNTLLSKIKGIFKFWGGARYSSIFYSQTEHSLFTALIKEQLAMSAAAGALIQYKDRQLSVINRVQDNYIAFISNIKQFYVRGGAGTGKTWIAMKMARRDAREGDKALFLCVSPVLARWIAKMIGTEAYVKDLNSLFKESLLGFSNLMNSDVMALPLVPDCAKYSSIYVDEAQDFTYEWAARVRDLLADSENSRLGVFYDEAQILKANSFGDGFDIKLPPFLLNENIRNTASIYSWTAQKTGLGMDVITNPVEGPEPETRIIHEQNQLTIRLENLLKKFSDEQIAPSSIVLLVENTSSFFEKYPDGIAKWRFTSDCENVEDIFVSSVDDFKGLEADVVIYIHSIHSSENMDYIAYTRAKYYLIEFIEVYM